MRTQPNKLRVLDTLDVEARYVATELLAQRYKEEQLVNRARVIHYASNERDARFRLATILGRNNAARSIIVQ